MIYLKKDIVFGNKISFDKEYREKVLLRHFQGLYANYELTINPINSNVIRLYSENEEANRYLESISHEIGRFIELYHDNDISINGFEITTRNDKFHAIDSKPSTYQITIIEALKRIIRKTDTRRQVIIPKLKGRNYSFETKVEKKEYRNLEWEEISTQAYVRIFDETKYLNTNGAIRIRDCEIDFHLESNINEWNTRSQNRVHLRFKKGEFTPNQMIEYLKIVELIMEDEYKNDCNVSGFIIYFEKNDTQVDIWKRKGENLIFEWAIRNILSSETTIEIKKEADR